MTAASGPPPIADLIRVLAAAGLAQDALDVAEAVWLAQHLTVASVSAEPLATLPALPVTTDDADEVEPLPRPPARPRTAPLAAVAPPTVGVAARGQLQRVSQAPALPDRIGVQRALRPFKRGRLSSRRRQLDEAATAELVADTRVWLPVLQPVHERWLDVAVVVDEATSMTVWQPLVAELVTLLSQLGAFRDVRVWRLHDDGTLASANGLVHRPEELRDPGRNRLFVVVTDCAGPIWHRGDGAVLLASLAATGPVAVLQPLPERLWARTGAPPRPGRFYAATAGSSHDQYRFSERRRGVHRPVNDGRLPVPALSIRPDWLAVWARLVADGTAGGVDLPAILVGPGAGSATSVPAAPQTDAETGVNGFRAAASPQAYRLAVCLAVAPLTRAIMGVVQHVTAPDTGPETLAEVMLSGLVMHVTDDIYEFRDGARALLLNDLRRSEAATVLAAVSRYVGDHSGGGPAFTVASRTDDGDAIHVLPESLGWLPAELVARGGWSTARRPNRELTTTIVFVPGLAGSKATWAPMRRLIAEDPDLADFRLATFEYETRRGPLTEFTNLSSIADALHAYLTHSVADADRLVLVAHSYGAAVVLRYLARHVSTDLQRTHRIGLVMLYATPRAPVEQQSLFRRLFGRREDPEALRRLADRLLYDQRIVAERLTSRSVPVEGGIPIHGYEAIQDSVVIAAAAGDSGMFTSVSVLPGDHQSIIKPERPEHPAFAVLKSRLLALSAPMPDIASSPVEPAASTGSTIRTDSATPSGIAALLTSYWDHVNAAGLPYPLELQIDVVVKEPIDVERVRRLIQRIMDRDSPESSVTVRVTLDSDLPPPGYQLSITPTRVPASAGFSVTLSYQGISWSYSLHGGHWYPLGRVPAAERALSLPSSLVAVPRGALLELQAQRDEMLARRTSERTQYLLHVDGALLRPGQTTALRASGTIEYTVGGGSTALAYDWSASASSTIFRAPLDHASSRAVLVGVSDYGELEPLPAIQNNVADLFATITDPAVMGLSPKRCHVALDPDSADGVLEALTDAARSCRGTLLVYFAGHGLVDDHGEVFLAMPRASRDRLYPAVSLDSVRRIVADSPATSVVVILDVVYSGRAMGNPSMQLIDNVLETLQNQATSRNNVCFVAAAASGSSQVLAGDTQRHSAFTGALLDTLRNGVPDDPEPLFDMASLVREINRALTARNAPRVRMNTSRLERIPIARNRAAGTAAVTPLPATPQPVAELHAVRNGADLDVRWIWPPNVATVEVLFIAAEELSQVRRVKRTDYDSAGCHLRIGSTAGIVSVRSVITTAGDIQLSVPLAVSVESAPPEPAAPDDSVVRLSFRWEISGRLIGSERIIVTVQVDRPCADVDLDINFQGRTTVDAAVQRPSTHQVRGVRLEPETPLNFNLPMPILNREFQISCEARWPHGRIIVESATDSY